MKILVDSSVWVGHFKRRNDHLVSLLEQGLVLCHPYVVAEVACGTPPGRQLIIQMLSELESAPVATQDELLALLNLRQLYGRGCGFVDISLLASALIGAEILLWTIDRRLALLAAEMRCGYAQAMGS